MSDMSPVEQVFFAALGKGTPAEREAYLTEACAGQPELRQRVEKLLAAHPQVGAFLEQGMGPTAVTAAYKDEHHSLLGTIIAGKYKLLEEIGEGGMGTVFVAEQTEPVKRKVAVKLIKAGMDSKNVLARFEAERQALAMMDHPNIARVLDAGLTEERRPYFVMEYIKGLPLTKYCDDVKLSIDERLKLFIQICQAVQHAHQKGIIHRDLKPTNILIALYDGKPAPKVIDFGLAKALHQSLTERTLHTGHEMVLGTPLYMSPEQAELNNLDIDTRSDIYSLGVILYELLTGVTPLEKQRFKEAAWAEVLRIIKEEEPNKPSTKLSHSESLPSVAAQRQMEPKKLSSLMKGDLDWIVMKALEKDRNRRYETANGFAMDIQRYLSDEPVSASPPSARYRLRKFVQRNKGQVIAGSLVLLALVAGVVGTSIGLYQANLARDAEARQRELAEAKEREANDERARAQAAAQREAERAEGEKKAKEEAETNLKYARKGNDILGSVFTGLDPKANYATVADLRNALRDNLTNAVKELEGSAIGDPLEVAAMQITLGRSLLGLGEFQLAIAIFRKARDTRVALLGPDHPDTLKSVNTLAEAYQEAGHLDQAVSLHKDTLDRRKTQFGLNHRDTLESMSNLALCYTMTGRLDLAIPLHKETMERQRKTLGSDDPDTMTNVNNLATCYGLAGQHDLALPLLKETLDRRRTKHGPDHPETLQSMGNLALGFQDVGRLDQALLLHKETLERMKAKLGPDHPLTLESMNHLSHGYQAARQFDLALPLLKEAVDRMKIKLGLEHPDTLNSMGNLAQCYSAIGQLELAVPLHKESLERKRNKLGNDHPNTLASMYNLAQSYRAIGQLGLALPLYEEAASGMEKKRFFNEGAKFVMSNTIRAYEDARQFDKADEWRRKWLQFVKEKSGIESSDYAGVLAAWGSGLLLRQKWAESESVFRECLAIRINKESDLWSTFNTQSQLGGALLGQKKYAEAEPLLLKGYEGMKEREKTIPPQAMARLPEALDRLIQLYNETNKPEEVKKWQAEKEKLPKPAPAKK